MKSLLVFILSLLVLTSFNVEGQEDTAVKGVII